LLGKMISTFFARKIKMAGKYTPEGNYVGATILSVPNMKVKDLRTKEKNGYTAVRLNIQDSRSKKDLLKEVRTDEILEPGAEIKFEEIVKPGDRVRVSGISKGKGFAGVVKRYHFKGGPRTHGQSDRERSPGSSGSTTTPGRVIKGKRRAGHMGNVNVSLSGLDVLEVNADSRTLVIGGGVPGPGNGKGNLVTISRLT
jgi:large subunit ribosomal protein L3